MPVCTLCSRLQMLRETVKDVKIFLDILLLVQVCTDCNSVKTQNRVHRFSSNFLIGGIVA